MNRNEFLANEKASRDTIDVKRVYIDMAGDIVSGVLLSQIVYWHLTDNTGKSRLRVEKNGELWLAKKREDWWDECRLSINQFDWAIKKLGKRQLVKSEVFKFDGVPVKHIRINWDCFLEVYNAIINTSADSVTWRDPKWIFGNFRNGLSEISEMDFGKMTTSETPFQSTPTLNELPAENGPEITTEITTENHHAPGFSENNDDDFEVIQKNEQSNPVRESFSSPGKKQIELMIENQSQSSIINRQSSILSVGNLPLDEYMNAVESRLSALQIRQMLSSLESPKVAEMYKAGVPLALILGTIDSVVKNSKRKIKSFNYFEAAIWEAFKAISPKQDKEKEYDATKRLIERLR